MLSLKGSEFSSRRVSRKEVIHIRGVNLLYWEWGGVSLLLRGVGVV